MQREVGTQGRLSARLTQTFIGLAAAPLVLVAIFLNVAARVGWLAIAPGAGPALWWFGLFLAAGGLVAAAGVFLFLRGRVTAPLRAISERAERFGEGEFDRLLAIDSDDEIGEAIASLNRLGDRLAMVRGDLEGQIEARTRELARALGELQVFKRLNEAVIHNIPSGIAILAACGRVLYINAAFERTWGIRPSRIGQELQSLAEGGPLAEIDWAAELARLVATPDGLRNITVEIGEWPHRRVVRYSLFMLPEVDLGPPLRLVGDHFCLAVLSPPHCQNECRDTFIDAASWQGRHFLLMIDDITDQRDLEAQLIQSEKLAALGQLSAGIAHEIRNPLSAISGAAFYIGEVLGDEAPDVAEVSEYVALIQRNVDRAQRIVTDILSFARPAASERDTVDLAELAEQTLGILDKSIVDHGVTLVRELTPGVLVHCRPEAVKQALVNLIVNALQAMSEGGTLTVWVGRDDAGRPAITVKDTGTGIAAEDLRQIFNPFFTTKPPGQGTGLGLSIARQGIEGDRGRLEVESELGRGTTFRILWPAEEPVEAEPAPAAQTGGDRNDDGLTTTPTATR